MRTLKSIRTGALAISAAALISSSAFAYTYQSSNLADQRDGDVVYVTGGIGENEIAELEYAKSEYNVHVTNSDKTGAYVSGTDIVIQDSRGREVLATDTGPLLLMNLPAGRYTVTAENMGAVQTKRLTVSARKPAKLQLVWNVPQ